VKLLHALSVQRNANVLEMRESERAFADLVENAARRLAGSRESGLLAAIERPWESFKSTNSQMAEKLRSGQTEEAVRLSTGPGLEAFSATEKGVEALEEYRKRESAREYRESQRGRQQARLWLCGLSILGSLLGLGTGYFIASVLANPGQQIVVVLQDLEHGDLTRTLTRDSGGEAPAISVTAAVSVASDPIPVEQITQAAVGSPSENAARIARLMDEMELQSNLLALNAAVHAAHAGGQDKAAVASLIESTNRVEGG
jgi:methyl-accepting chemotaxis protein